MSTIQSTRPSKMSGDAPKDFDVITGQLRLVRGDLVLKTAAGQTYGLTTDDDFAAMHLGGLRGQVEGGKSIWIRAEGIVRGDTLDIPLDRIDVVAPAVRNQRTS